MDSQAKGHTNWRKYGILYHDMEVVAINGDFLGIKIFWLDFISFVRVQASGKALAFLKAMMLFIQTWKQLYI